MGLREEIRQKTNDTLNNDFKVEEVDFVPKLRDLHFGNKGLKFTGAVLFIDMRGSTEVLNNHNKTTVGKLHTCFFHTIVKIANSMEGSVRSFNGDSALIFFQGKPEIISTAVKCAMRIKFMLSNTEHGINTQLSKYRELDFGIGVDYGEVLCTKVGIGGEQHNGDLFWIGNCVNKSTRLGSMSRNPNHVSTSKYVYDRLSDNLRIGQRYSKLWEERKKINMWTEDEFEYNGVDEYYYFTDSHFSVY